MEAPPPIRSGWEADGHPEVVSLSSDEDTTSVVQGNLTFFMFPSKMLSWDIGKINPQKLPSLKGTMGLQVGASKPDENPTINLQFKIQQLAISGEWHILGGLERSGNGFLLPGADLGVFLRLSEDGCIGSGFIIRYGIKILPSAFLGEVCRLFRSCPKDSESKRLGYQ